MSRQHILQPGLGYIFSEYFELPLAPADIWLKKNYNPY